MCGPEADRNLFELRQFMQLIASLVLDGPSNLREYFHDRANGGLDFLSGVLRIEKES